MKYSGKNKVMSTNIEKYFSLFTFDTKQQKCVNDFIALCYKTLEIYPETIFISSLWKNTPSCNLAIDTSNDSSKNNPQTSHTYNKIILDFCSTYFMQDSMEKLQNFIAMHTDSINISCNISENETNINICYTSKSLSFNDSESIMKHYKLDTNVLSKENFICLNINTIGEEYIKHYSLKNISEYHDEYKILSPFLPFADTCMYLTRFHHIDKSYKTYINTYNSWLKNSFKMQWIFKKLWIIGADIDLFKDKKVWSIASIWNTDIEIYIIL